MRIMHVQVLRRGHGILIEVIDVGLLADVAFIGAMHIMPANHDEWLPPVDGFFDLVRNPQGGAVMRPWYESFDGVPVIELCLRGILAGTMPTMPIPTAPPAFAGISIDYPPFPGMMRRPGLRPLGPRSMRRPHLRSLGPRPL